MGGIGRKRSSAGSVTAGLRGLNASVDIGGLVLVARVGGFNPNGKRDRAHHDASLLAAHRKGGASAAEMMLYVSGHLKRIRESRLQPACQA
jgi:hypothetical protein